MHDILREVVNAVARLGGISHDRAAELVGQIDASDPAVQAQAAKAAVTMTPEETAALAALQQKAEAAAQADALAAAQASG